MDDWMIETLEEVMMAPYFCDSMSDLNKQQIKK